MDFYNKYKSPLGYQTGENQIDSYGVDHSGFTLRDELAYQMARQQRENQIIKNYNNHGITQDYPQSGTNFWGSSSDNNFGFGNSHISPNIENMNNTLTANIQNQTYNNSTETDTNSSFVNSINPYARIKQLLEQNDYTQNQAQSFEQKVNDTNQQEPNSTLPAQNNYYMFGKNMFGNNNTLNQTMLNQTQTQSVWNKDQYQTPAPLVTQSVSFRNNKSVPARPINENPNNRRYSTGEILKGFSSAVTNGATHPATTIGELIADIVIAKDYYDKMNETGRKLVNIYGSGQAANIDNYYHPLLQCQLAKISPNSQRNGILLGYAKEGWDYFKKIFNNQSHQSIIEDSKKDLQNNQLGSTLGQNNPDKSCLELLDYLRTPNMRKQNIW